MTGREVTLAEWAALTGHPVRRVRRWAFESRRTVDFPRPVRMAGRTGLYLLDDLDRWLAESFTRR
jgi:predicted DNA-binding transcriptional regulator AlpA